MLATFSTFQVFFPSITLKLCFQLPQNIRELTVSRGKMVTVKKSNHKIRSRDLLMSLRCYTFMCSGSENYNRNRKCRNCLHNLSHGCRCASWLTFWQLYYFSTFYFLAYWLVALADMAVLKAIVSLYRGGEEKPKTAIIPDIRPGLKSRKRINYSKTSKFFKNYKLHSPYWLVQFFVVFEKFARACLFQIQLEIIWLPIQICLKTFSMFYNNGI